MLWLVFLDQRNSTSDDRGTNLFIFVRTCYLLTHWSVKRPWFCCCILQFCLFSDFVSAYVSARVNLLILWRSCCYLVYLWLLCISIIFYHYYYCYHSLISYAYAFALLNLSHHSIPFKQRHKNDVNITFVKEFYY